MPGCIFLIFYLLYFMYAIVEIGGKQYRVTEGDVVQVERLENDIDTNLVIKTVVMLENGEDVTVGAPFVPGASVSAEVLDQYRDKKIMVVKKNAKKRYEKKQGHRQYKTSIKITGISKA